MSLRLVFHEADFFVTRQRSDAFAQTIAENYPDLLTAWQTVYCAQPPQELAEAAR